MTTRLYLSDSYLREFEARVLSVESAGAGVAIELDRTAFYAESGGQPPDHGAVGETRIEDVQADGARVLHYAGHTAVEAGQPVTARVDWGRRFDHMQQHTGQHVLSQAFVKTLDASTVSFHLGAGISTVDLDVEALDPDSIYAAEDLANQIIFENRPVTVHEVDSDDQSRFPLRKLSSRQGRLRIVEVGDFDWSPCGGTHCRRTGEIGLIKVRRWERHRGRARVEFVCGTRALADYRRKNRIVYRLTGLLSVPDSELLEAASRQSERLEAAGREIKELTRQLVSAEASMLAATAVRTGGLERICHEFESCEPARLRDLALELVGSGSRVVLFAAREPKPTLLFARSPGLDGPDLRPILEESAALIEGRGGGSPHLVQAGGTRTEGLAEALDSASDAVDKGATRQTSD